MRARDFAPSLRPLHMRAKNWRVVVCTTTYLLDLYYLYSDLETFVWLVCCKTTS